MSEAVRDAALTLEKVVISYTAIARLGDMKRLRVREKFALEAISNLRRIAEDEAREREQGKAA